MIRVLLADDHKLVRKGIRSLLAGSNRVEVIAEAGSGEEAIRLARTCAPDVVLMDVGMPGMGGLEATRKLLRAVPTAKVIVLSVYVSGPVPSRMLEAGASGYLSKACDAREMIRAIQTVHAGDRYVCAEIAQHLVLSHLNGSRPPIDSLSGRELEVLVLVSKGEGLQQISEKLCLSPKTVSTYRRRLMKKLGLQTDVELTHLALRHGLIEPFGTV
jgi:two-component system, NarL family, invasion response regulator UvrY